MNLEQRMKEPKPAAELSPSHKKSRQKSPRSWNDNLECQEVKIQESPQRPPSPIEDVEESKDSSFEMSNPQDNPKKKRIRKKN